jgi:glycosyltransferase involved in cell wall biosynthesis
MAHEHATDTDELIKAKLDFGDAVSDWFIRQAERELAVNGLDESLRLVHIAASVLVRQNRRLVDPQLETVLRAIARKLGEDAAPNVPQLGIALRKPIWLHVLDEALPAGGLTSMAKRWIEADSAARAHCLVLMGQHVPVPDGLAQAVRRSGGHIIEPPSCTSALHKARWLRSIARANAQVVVLHAGVSDTTTLAAFAAAGGPPVVLVNHAAHIYWVGSSIVDLVANCRGSKLEIEWTERYRDAPAGVLPIPLEKPTPEVTPASIEFHQLARARFGLHATGAIILTIGARFKYGKTADHDFLTLMENVLRRHPDASLLALGVTPDMRWNAAAKRMGGRIITTGPVPYADVALAQSIASVYAEGFPFGTTTSLLESALHGVPAVLAPATCSPPYGSDGVAIDGVIDRPADAASYCEHLSKLLDDPALARATGERLAASVREHHLGAGWHKHLSALRAQIPTAHEVRPPRSPPSTPVSIHAQWLQFVEQADSPFFESLEHATTRALVAGLRPRLDAEMQAACERVAKWRKGQGIPLWCLRILLNNILPKLSVHVATRLFRVFAFCNRHRSIHGFFGRTISFTRHGRSRGWYESYRVSRP